MMGDKGIDHGLVFAVRAKASNESTPLMESLTRQDAQPGRRRSHNRRTRFSLVRKW